ncbi:hypothetical protein AUR64_09760 [Haloprofundus marisrubri]|uniref:Uncharacterized protein n=1 Tax=Haloprofundus marisrubri TaxID=1514971 RepID=A0A0W1R914_9EURY|nr:hypothetical protein [Haloprofundus marisrubri]KTG09901.1 hypothetical protein AUR64_09760 [Haloprofundus marisrubri]
MHVAFLTLGVAFLGIGTYMGIGGDVGSTPVWVALGSVFLTLGIVLDTDRSARREQDRLRPE